MLCRNCGKAERDHGVASGRCPTQYQDERSVTHWKPAGREHEQMYGVQGLESCPGCLGDGEHWTTCHSQIKSKQQDSVLFHAPREQVTKRDIRPDLQPGWNAYPVPNTGSITIGGTFKAPVKVVNPKFHKALKKMAEIHDKKSADYATDSNRYANFEYAAKFAGVTVEQVFDVLIGVKQARLLELTSSGKTPNNESIEDTRLDQAVYTVLKYSYFQED